jgi:hypothetical protein
MPAESSKLDSIAPDYVHETLEDLALFRRIKMLWIYLDLPVNCSNTATRSVLLQSSLWNLLAILLLPFSQPHARASTVLLDELDAGCLQGPSQPFYC